MRVQEIIRGILDMIDHAEKSTDIAHPDGSNMEQDNGNEWYLRTSN